MPHRAACIRAADDEQLTTGERGEISHLGVERSLADEHNGDTAAGADDLLHVQRVALPVGHQENVRGL